jgi:ParB-like chromosome segregation protein Spo0J
MSKSPIKWNLQRLRLANLKPYPKNPRTLSKSQEKLLRESLSKFGLATPIVVNLDGTIIGGHQRVSILRKGNVLLVDCYAPSRLLNEREVEELNIQLNKSGGSFDYDILANEYDILDLKEWGFSEKELLGIEDFLKEPVEKCPHCGEELNAK